VNPRLQTQFVGDVDAAADCVSEGHATQSLSDTAPVVPRYLPAPQTVHVTDIEAPVAVEYVPAPQSRHVAEVEAPVAAEYLPAPQSAHAAEPVLVLYFPGAQAKHDPLSGPVYPVLHKQAVDPTADCESAGQERQTAELVAPACSE